MGTATDNYNWRIGDYRGQDFGGITIAIKDLIDLQGVVTTAGSRLVASRARKAPKDANCLVGVRDERLTIVGKTNLTELAFGTTGINHWWGTPPNPIDPSLIPGGSSSGSVVAVTGGFADIALGSDSGGSIRIPSAACGAYGLKTTWSRVSNEGVWPLAPSLDSIGPIANDIDGLAYGFGLLSKITDLVVSDRPLRVGLISNSQDESFNSLFRSLVREVGWELGEVKELDLRLAHEAASVILVSEAARSNSKLFNELHRIDPVVRSRLLGADEIADSEYVRALRYRHSFAHLLDTEFERYDLLINATIPFDIPKLSNAYSKVLNTNTIPFNFSGNPALAIPLSIDFSSEVTGSKVSIQGGQIDMPVPVSLQIIAPMGSEELLLFAGREIERKGLSYLRSSTRAIK